MINVNDWLDPGIPVGQDRLNSRVYRRILAFWVVLLGVAAAFGPAQARYASIVIDAKTGKVLHAVNPDTENFPASLSKMMTLYLTFEALDAGTLTLDKALPVSRTAASRSPSKLGLHPGETITVREVIGALVTKSANDAATVAAEGIGKTERHFAELMTAKAHQLGMIHTTFKNASGLPHWRQRSTARDMAKLARALLQDFPHYYHYFAMTSFTYDGRSYGNHNKLMKRYDGMDGLKTGYIRASGFNLAASAERSGVRLIGVVFGGKSPRWRDNHMADLLDRSFEVAIAEAEAADVPVPKHKPDPLGETQTASIAQERTEQWAIQVGAFERYAPAHLAVTRAARAVPSLLNSKVAIVPDEAESGKVYRARLIGMSESGARGSCAQLQKRKIPCVVVPAETSLAQGSQ